ncbi:tyrosine-protein phosphatase 69D [Condylostylus longicornis]|uniref:tyrosine-protein phosphatase 69D n=1 Tax=Condylostylus longicornis TaxID=2530218 RepID=UPI00244DE2F5|nr:tyrosine-protein phosphatase 69D [Condylostylus longicornis]
MFLSGGAMTQGRCTLLFCIFFIFSATAEEHEIDVEKNITLKCPTTLNEPVWWSFNGENVTNENKRWIISMIPSTVLEENSLTETAETATFINGLTIKEVKIEDEGNFTCHFSEIDTLSTKSFWLQPIIRPKIISHSEKVIKSNISDTVSFFCYVHAYPYPSRKWKQKWQKNFIDLPFDKNSMTEDPINKTHTNFSMKIEEVRKADNGTYSCDVSSLYSEEKIDLTLLVLDVPQVSIEYVKAVGAHKIFMNWTVNSGNDPIKKYFVTFRQEGNTTFTYYNNIIDGKNTSLVLENFQPNTNYQFKLSATNSIGHSVSYSYPHWIKTLEKDPIFVPKIETTGSSASTITISWSPPPPDLLEYVQNYELVVSEAGESRVIETITYQQNSRNLPYMFDNLKTATVYFFKVRACCELCRSCGPWSEIINGTTMDGKASEPRNLKIDCRHLNISRLNKVMVTWDTPQFPNGKVVSYNIELTGLATYRSFNQIKNETWGPKVLNSDASTQRAIFENVVPNTNYTVSVFAKTRNKRTGDIAKATCTMPVTTPDVIEKIIMTKIKTYNNKCVYKVFLPRISERNGNICCYRLYLVRTDGSNKELVHPEDLPISTYNEVHESNNTKGGAYIVEMFPASDFKSEIFLGDGKRIYSDPASEKQGDKACLRCLKNQPIKKFTKHMRKNYDTTLSGGPPLLPEETQREELERAGNLTQDASKILGNKRRRRHPKLSMSESEPQISVQLEDTDLIAPMINTNQYEIFDGELDASSNYTGFLEIIVENNNHGSEKMLTAYSGYFEITTPKDFGSEGGNNDDMSFIFNIVVQVLCALILLVLLLLVALCFMHRYYTKNAGQGDEIISLRDSLSRAFCGGRTSNHRHLIGSALNKPTDIGPISKTDLPQAYVNRHKDTDYGFLREYEMLPNRFNDRTTKNSDMKENAHKNRYPDIKAYDQTRVKLSLVNGVQGSDYINANFVIGYKERKKFICAQGPMDSTIIDFWRMIWEQHLEIIVMLTNLEEYNKSKCAKYWPEKVNDSKHYGDITVTFASEQRFSDFLIRNLNILKKTDNEENEQRQIQQYHYLVWKDFMAPEHPYGIIKFIRQINSAYSVQRGPILVHCSAGVGRTGTMVALDSLMQQLEEEGLVSIFNTVCDLRHQRNFLVQSLKQYIFLYRALLDISQFGNTELHAKNLCATLENLKHKPNDSKEKCKLELECEKIKAVVDETNKSCSVGSGEENLSKNRSDAVIPFDRNRVILTPIPTREHSTYINASFIEGYDNSESFIITQDPLENTIGDFWRMISEQSINTLVMISEIGDGPRKCPRYWADEEVQYDHILVRYIHSESCPYYTRREFDVTNCKINDTIKVTQFQYNGWPTVEGEVPEVCRGIIELVDQAQKHHNAQNSFSSQSPIAVHCSLGTDRSSIFVAMCILVQQLRTEKKVDICTTTRKLRSQRSMLLDTYPQYEFLHRAILNYAELHKLTGDSTSEC